MPEFGRLRKHEKTQHALVGLGSAALVAAVALPRLDGPSFPQGIIKRIICVIKNQPYGSLSFGTEVNVFLSVFIVFWQLPVYKSKVKGG